MWTLTTQFGIQHVRNLKNQGAVLFCWSSGGAVNAKQSAQEFSITDGFEAFLSEPNIMLDDQQIGSWKQYICIHPSSCGDKTLEDYRASISM
jgi:hypothetical protein